MKLQELFENANASANLKRAYERILDVVKNMGDRLDDKKKQQVKNIQIKLKSMMTDPVSDDQANNYAEQVHTFVQKLHDTMSSKQFGDRDDLRNQKNDKQANREMRDEADNF